MGSSSACGSNEPVSGFVIDVSSDEGGTPPSVLDILSDKHEAPHWLDVVDDTFIDSDPPKNTPGYSLPSLTSSSPFLVPMISSGSPSPALTPSLLFKQNDYPTIIPKRRRSVHSLSDSDLDLSDSNESRAYHTYLKRLNRSGAKAKSSWARQKISKSVAKSADFTPNSTRLSHFKTKIMEDDAHAEIDRNNVCRVRCSACTCWVVMRTLYDIRRWKEHRSSARCQSIREKGLITRPIHAFFPPSLSKTRPSAPTARSLCSGLTRDQFPKVRDYLKRSLATGGGAPSRTTLAKGLFGKNSPYKFLTSTHKKMVLRREEMMFKWQNNRSVGAVFSLSCMKEVAISAADGRHIPCAECLDLLHLHTFQNALNRDICPDEHMKFTPGDRRDQELGDLYMRVKGVRDLVETVSFVETMML